VKPPTWRGAALALCIMMISLPLARAEDPGNGRYQAITTQMGGTSNVTNVLILDTKEGHLWRYWQSGPVGSIPGSEGIKYIFQLRPAALFTKALSALSTTSIQLSYFRSYVRQRIHFGFFGARSRCPDPHPRSVGLDPELRFCRLNV
jgi:hypothetical protein